jgi:competence protein ComEA
MVALAGIGAASTLAGSGVPVASAAPAASVTSTTNAPQVPVAQSVAPATSAAAAPSAPAPAPSSPSPGGGVTADGKIVLNEATADELTKLPRVGPKRAQAIVDLRHHLGRFHQPTDLLRVKGIGRKTLRLMLPLLVVDAKPPSQS